jgi:hypothetical protein
MGAGKRGDQDLSPPPGFLEKIIVERIKRNIPNINTKN